MTLSFEKVTYFTLGLIAFALSFTSLREMGLGRSLEILFFLLILTALALLIHQRKINLNVSFIPFLFFIFFMAPLTFLNFFQGFPGSSIETLFALILASIAGFTISQSSNKNMIISSYGMGISSLSILFILFFSGFSFDGLVRFSALSDNPNQLALYSLSALLLVTLFLENSKHKFIFAAVLIICGALAISDAFFLAVGVGLFFYVFSKSIVSWMFLVFILPMLITAILLLFLWTATFYDLSILSYLLELWRAADQGGTRSSLYINGLIAFSNAPILGYGGGAFAGISIPFEKFEAHNTVIDFATMGGVILPLIFYLPFLVGFFSSLKKDPIQNAAISAFIAFSMFHFIGRHPIVWMAWGACLTVFILNSDSSKELRPRS